MIAEESIELREGQAKRRQDLFLAGPLTFGWIQINLPDPVSRFVLVARAFMDMERTSELALSRKVWAGAGVDGKDARRRVLQKLSARGGDYEVISRPGRTSLLRKRETAGALTGAASSVITPLPCARRGGDPSGRPAVPPSALQHRA